MAAEEGIKVVLASAKRLLRRTHASDASAKAAVSTAQAEIEEALRLRRLELEAEMGLSSLRVEAERATASAIRRKKKHIRQMLRRIYRGDYGRGTLVICFKGEGGREKATLVRVVYLMGDEEKISHALATHRWIATCCASGGAHVDLYSPGMADTERKGAGTGYRGLEHILLSDYDGHQGVAEVSLEGTSEEEYCELWEYMRTRGFLAQHLEAAFRGRYRYQHQVGQYYWCEQSEVRGHVTDNYHGTTRPFYAVYDYYIVRVSESTWGVVSVSDRRARFYGTTTLSFEELVQHDRIQSGEIELRRPTDAEIAVVESRFGRPDIGPVSRNPNFV